MCFVCVFNCFMCVLLWFGLVRVCLYVFCCSGVVVFVGEVCCRWCLVFFFVCVLFVFMLCLWCVVGMFFSLCMHRMCYLLYVFSRCIVFSFVCLYVCGLVGGG